MPSDKVEQIKPSLPIREDLDYQERGRTIQRIASNIVLGLSVLIALGLFGNGPLSDKKVQQGNTTLLYERFLHQLGTTETDLLIREADSITTIALPLSYLEHFTIEAVVPEAMENRIIGNELVYRFRTAGTGRVRFQLSALRAGAYKDTLRVNGTPLSFFYFTYP